MRTVVLLGVLLVVVAALAWGLQRRLLYLPGGPPPPVDRVLPSAEAVDLATGDGLSLRAWFVEAGPTAVLLLPGNAGNRAGRAPLARALADTGLSVLLVDYRGYGGNPGSPSDDGLALDARAAAAWLRDRPGVRRVVYLGESLGAAVAVRLAVEHPPAALILRSPFRSLAAVARVHYGPVPGWLLRDAYPTEELIGRVDAPVLVVAGERDRVVPVDQSRVVHELAGEPKRLVTIPRVGHNDPALLAGPRLVGAVVDFLADHDVPVGD